MWKNVNIDLYVQFRDAAEKRIYPASALCSRRSNRNGNRERKQRMWRWNGRRQKRAIYFFAAITEPAPFATARKAAAITQRIFVMRRVFAWWKETFWKYSPPFKKIGFFQSGYGRVVLRTIWKNRAYAHEGVGTGEKRWKKYGKKDSEKTGLYKEEKL